MCRNIKPLFNFEPPAAEEDVHEAALQFVRKISGYNQPSQANEAAFNRAVDEVTEAAQLLLDSLVTRAPRRDRTMYVARARARAAERFRDAAS